MTFFALLVAVAAYGVVMFVIGKTHAEHDYWRDGMEWGRAFRRGIHSPTVDARPVPRPFFFDHEVTCPDLNDADDVVMYARTQKEGL